MIKYFIAILISIVLTASVVFCQPVIQSFSPSSGPVGTTVTIRGNGFDTLAVANTIFFGAVRGVASSSTDTTITVNVPYGALYQPLTVTTSKGTAYSSSPFVVTYNGAGAFNAGSFLPKTDFPSAANPHGLSLADFNNDGKPDLVVANGSSGNISVLTNNGANGTVSFSAAINVAASGNSHECSATGDFDGDGRIDFVVTNTWGTNSISIFRNVTTGPAITFAPKVDYATDNGAYSVAVGDLDGDGKPDIIVANNGSDKISVYKNKSIIGLISFDNRIDLPAGTNPYSVTLADLDGDKKPELIYTTQSTGSALSVMKNQSVKDSFAFDVPIAVANFSAPFVVQAGDLDGDGLPDLVAAAAGNNAVIVKRNLSTPGNPAFSGQQPYFSTGNYPVGLVLADIDGDGKADVVTCNRYTNNVSVLRNASSTGSIAFDAHVDYAVGTDPFFVTAGDLNSDGRPDIIAANSAAFVVSVLTNVIGANITPTIQSFSPSSGINGTSVKIKGTNFTGATAVSFGGMNAASFTVDADSVITAIVGQGNSGDVAVTTPKGTISMPGFTFLGPTITSFTPTVGVTGTTVSIYGTNFTDVSSVKFGGTAAASFTVNTSTYISAVVSNGSSGEVSVTTPNGTATLSSFSYGVPVITSVDPLSAPVGATVTITGNNFSSTATDNIVFFGAVKAAVSSATATELKVIVPAGATYQPLAVTVNRLTAYSSMPFSTSFAADSTTITANSFRNARDYGTGSYPVNIRFCDLNNDGKPDIITANAQGNSISVLKNLSTSGNLSFLQKVDLAAGLDTKQIVISDLDGDGRQDVIAVNFNSGKESTISVFRNTSTTSVISFAPKQEYVTGNGTIGLGVGDINGDGKPDIVTASGNSGFFSIFLNTTTAAGTINFSARQDISTPTHGNHLAIADLDKDGKPDIVISSFGGSALSVYRNLSSGGNLLLDSRLSIATDVFPTYLEAADIDGDKKLDIILKNSDHVSVLKNNSNPGFIELRNILSLNVDATNTSVSDLNGDGKPDLCLGTTLTGYISVVENQHTITDVAAFGTPVNLKPGTYDTFVATGDLDGDGKPELAAVNTFLNTVSLFSNTIDAPVINPPATLSSKAGDTLSITGSGFTGTTAVKFGGTPAASFKVISSDNIEAVVGDGASGTITVTTPKGTASYPGFSFIPGVSANGITTFCNGASVVLTSSAGVNNQWYRNNTPIAGATAQTFTANTSGNYTVKTTSNNITTSSATGIDVTVITVPTPVITFNGSTLTSNAASGNQWYLNGTLIQGATAQTYQPTQTGDYTVQVTANGCTSAFSVARNFVITGVANLPNGQFISLYPNPVRDQIIINFQLNSAVVLSVEIFDINGRRIKIDGDLHSGDVINMKALPAGMYTIKFSSKSRLLGSIKMIKTD